MIEKSIFQSEKVFRELFDNISNGVAVYEGVKGGNNFVIRDFNKAGELISKVKREEVIGKLVTEIFPSVKEFGLFEVFQRVWKTGKSENHPISLYKDDRIINWVENYVYKLPSGFIVAIYNDLTERKGTEEKLIDSEIRFKNIFMESPVALTLYDSDGKLLNANKACLDLINVSTVEQVRGFDILDDPNMPRDIKERVLSGETVKFEIEYDFDKVKFTLKPGLSGTLYFDAIINPIHSTNNDSVDYYLVQVQDITERRLAEIKLKESEDKLKQLNKELEQIVEDRTTELKDSDTKYRVLFEQAGDMIIVLNAETGDIVDFNDRVHENLGYTREEFNNIRVPDFDIMEENEDYHAHIEKIIKNGFDIFETKYRTKSGEVRDILVHAKAIKIKEKTFLHSILRDITDLKEMDEKLKESEEMFRKAYYQANLYRDIFAHDINNILQNIHSSAELSSLYLNNPEKLHTISELYEIIHEQVQRGRKLIKNVRKINEIDDSEIELERIEAFQLLDNAILFLKNSFQARTLDIKIKTQEKKVYVLANNLLLDVFENILINAVRHNNSTKIKIDVEISKEKIEEKKYFRMEFKDNGLGISDYRKKIIFEKGTRKSQKSKGMGLGLSLVKKIIDSYQGDIWVEDRVKGEYKQGSNFVILLQEA